jgi:hypothetical protein
MLDDIQRFHLLDASGCCGMEAKGKGRYAVTVRAIIRDDPRVMRLPFSPHDYHWPRTKLGAYADPKSEFLETASNLC